MAAELAVALGVVAGKVVVARLIAGTPPTREAWAGTGREVVDAVVSASSDAQGSLRQIARKIDRMPLERYAEHMAVGRRFMDELPATWRTDEDRRDFVRDARTAFVHAVAVAERIGDVCRQAEAEVAVAACWLWVPSLDDVKQTLARAEGILENQLPDATVSRETLELYQHVHELRRRFEGDALSRLGAMSISVRPGSVGVSHAGIKVSVSAATLRLVRFTVKNGRREEIRIQVSRDGPTTTSAQPVDPYAVNQRRVKGRGSTSIDAPAPSTDELVGIEVAIGRDEFGTGTYRYWPPTVRIEFWYEPQQDEFRLDASLPASLVRRSRLEERQAERYYPSAIDPDYSRGSRSN